MRVRVGVRGRKVRVRVRIRIWVRIGVRVRVGVRGRVGVRVSQNMTFPHRPYTLTYG